MQRSRSKNGPGRQDEERPSESVAATGRYGRAGRRAVEAVERGWCGGEALAWGQETNDRTAVVVAREQQRDQKRKTGTRSGGRGRLSGARGWIRVKMVEGRPSHWTAVPEKHRGQQLGRAGETPIRPGCLAGAHLTVI